MPSNLAHTLGLTQAKDRVSRQILKDRGGSVTAFAFDAGEIIHLPAGIPHAVQADERFRMLPVMIRTDG